jgi:hypothetical protein
MVAGISGTGAASGPTEGDDEKDGRLVLLQAPRNIASAEAIPRLATVCALRDLTMVSPKQLPAALIRSQIYCQTQNSCRSNDVPQITPALRFSFRKHPISASPRT